MSVFDLSSDDSDALEEHAQLNIAQQNEPEGDFTKGFATSAGNSFVNAGFVQLGKRTLMAGAVAPILYDKASSAVTGKENTDSQDWYFKNAVEDVGQRASEYWTPDAAHTNMAGEIVGSVAGGLLNFAVSGFNPVVVGLGAYDDASADMTHAGASGRAADAIGVVNAVAAGAGVKLPAAVGSTLMQRLATGAIGNTLFGMAQRGATSEILDADGNEEMAANYNWRDVKSVAADALMGAAFGGQHHYFGNHAKLDIPETQKQPLQDAVLTLNAEDHANTTVAPGEPTTPASAAIHHNALSAAIKQVIDGEPVNVGDKINKAEFSLRDELPSVKQLRGDLTDLLTEDGRNQFAQQLLDHQGPEGAYKTHEEARFVVDQFGAGIQKLHGAGVSMDRLSQLRTSFGKPAEAGAVFNQHGADEAPAAHVPEDLDMTPEMEALFREHGIDIHAAGDSVKSTAEGVDANGYRITSEADRSRYLQQFDTRTPKERALGTGEGGSDTARLPTGKPIAKNYTEGSQLLEKVRERSHSITDELKGSPENARRNADAALGPFKGYGVDAKVVGERLHIKYYSDAQKKAGLTDEPALTVILNKTGELVINGPAADSPTFAEFQKRGWADYATKGDGTKSEFWTKLTNPDKSLATDSMHNVLADAHARLRAWRKEDKVGINWQRYTGATGHAQAGKKGVTFFQSAYHGTPYKFDKFSLDHMGKGEGAQAYGWGLYFAGSKDVSEYYRKNLTGASGNPIKIDNSSLIPRTNERTLGEALDSIDREILIRKSNIQSAKENPDVFTDGHVKTLKAELAAYEKRRDEVNRKGGQLYKVDIPEDDTFLLWDKPLSDSQSGAIRGKLLSNGKDVLDTLGDGKTGVDLYKRLSQLLDGDEAASKFLHKHGINGIKYLDGTSRGKGDGNYNYVIFDDNAVQILETYYQKGGDAFARNINGTTEAPQGQINFGIDGEKLNAVISLFGTANKSTALHELSHNFLEIYKHLNQFEDTPASVKADYAEMRRLIGADDIGSPLKTEHHERFAQAFEQYTREGKAPTPALKRAFEHFKEWMTAIYQRAADLGAPINDDIRAMFDKMLGKEIPVEHFDPLLKNKDVQNELRRQAQNAGWAEVGGKVIMDENRVVTGRTSWMPKEEWYAAGMGSQADVERAVGKAIRGEKLSKKQQSIVAAMLDSPAHDAAREDMQLNAAMGKTTDGETPEQKAARMAEMDAFFDSIPEAAGVSDILKSADGLLVPQDDGSTVSARQLMESLHTELQESDAMPKVYDAAINCFLRG